jgi:hypothetical protein
MVIGVVKWNAETLEKVDRTSEKVDRTLEKVDWTLEIHRSPRSEYTWIIRSIYGKRIMTTGSWNTIGSAVV